MTLVLGADEAGYGPNLGPLVVAVTAWEVSTAAAGAAAAVDAALAPFAAARASAAGTARRVPASGPLWADSKQVHRAGAGLEPLESGALTALALVVGDVPSCWEEVLSSAGAPAGSGRGVPEAAMRAALRLPLESGPAAGPRERAAQVGAALAARGVTLRRIGCRVVEPEEFNDRLAAGENKSDILSRTTLDLVAGIVGRGVPAVVCCDRHGGRKRYAPLLVRQFGTPLVRIEEEAAERSAYSLPGAGIEIEFRVRAEVRPPVAVASMVAKYVRELAMRAFNRHWQAVLPGLAATAGYPLDARRWRDAAAAAVASAGVPWDRVWRRA